MKNSTRNSSMGSDPQSCTFTNGLIRYFGTLIFLIGLLSTILSICVFARKPLRRKSCCLYFLVLAVSDSVNLSMMFLELLPISFHLDLITLHAGLCKSVVFLIYFTNHFSNVILTLASIDRFVLIYFPSRSKRYCTIKKAKCLIALSVLTLSLANGHLLYGYEILHEHGTATCFIDPNKTFYQQFYLYYDSYLESFLFVLLPFLVMFVCSLLIILQIFETRKTIRYNTKGKFYYYTFATGETIRQTVRKTLREQGNTRLRDKDIQLCFMLIGTTLAFLLLCLPTEINDFYNVQGRDRSCSHWFRKVLFILIQQIYYAGHLFIYTLTGQLFRKHLRAFLFGSHPDERATFAQKILTNFTHRPLRAKPSFTTTSFIQTASHRPPTIPCLSNDPTQRLLSDSKYIIGTY